MTPDLHARVAQLKREYSALVEQYRQAGYSKPEYRARGPKLEAYRLLSRDGVENPAKYFREVKPWPRFL